MTVLPKIETVTRDATISHFLLMFGYKLFSFYFSLYLVQKGLSLHQVGYTYLLIYLPLAFFSPVVGFLSHKVSPAILASLGIAGYGAYSLGLLIFPHPFLFYSLQAVLGISAALFFVSSRAILMGLAKENPARSFSWFYSASNYADIVAPAVGALLIWKFGFSGVFVVSFLLHSFNILFMLFKLYAPTKPLKDHVLLGEVAKNYKSALKLLSHRTLGPVALISLAGFATGGFYQAFFVLFLKDLGWSQNEILLFGTVSSLVFIPISVFVARYMKKREGMKTFFQGISLYSIGSVFLGFFGNMWGFFSMLFFSTTKDAGALAANASRSGILAKVFAPHSEEAGAIDTIFSPLGQSLGFVIGGFLLGIIGYPLLFAGGGIFMLFSSLSGWFAKKEIRV